MAQSIFTSQVPVITNGDDGVAYTLGTLFSRAADGSITHGRWFFPDPVPAGTTDWVLYPGTSAPALARASFVAPVAGTWNTVELASPVPYTAGTSLIAAVRTSGKYVATGGFFAADLVTGDITAPAAGNGVLDTADQHPGNASGSSACFFADVVFAAPPPTDVEPVRGGSAARVSAGRSSSAAVTAGRTSSASASAGRTSTPTVSGG